MTARLTIFAAISLLAFGCAAGEDDDPTVLIDARDYTDHETPEDFAEAVVSKTGATSGLPSRFDRNRVMDDGFFTAVDAVSAGQVQAFFETNPYGRRSFLADVRVNGVTAAEAIVAESRAKGINPIVMIARMQVEKSLVAKTSNPGGNSLDYAFGCGCPDGRACNSAYRGLDKQIRCAADVLKRHYDGSVRGDGLWNRGVGKRTLDPITVTPANHATSSLYAYTPWVLEGRGGNWLVWNITRRYAEHFATLGPVNLPDAGAPGAQPARDAWIGEACDDQAVCSYSNGLCAAGDGRGMCSQVCEGLCPDRNGYATTFCVDAVAMGGDAAGRCTVYASSHNDDCRALGMIPAEMPRYIGGSGRSAATARVCIFAATAGGGGMSSPPPEGFGGCPVGLDAAGTCDGDTVVRCVNDEAVRTDCRQYNGSCVEDISGAHCVARAQPVDPGQPPAAACPPGIDVAGTCDGNTVITCVDGQVSEFDCAGLGAQCEDGPAGARCVAPPPPPVGQPVGCGAIGPQGTCDGNTAVRCTNGALDSTDCGQLGQTCGQGEIGAACRPTNQPLLRGDPDCPRVPAEGFCHGNTAVWCAGGDSYAVDCDWYGASCTYDAGDGDGWWCRY